MSHQDRKSREPIVVNHESIKQAFNFLFTSKTWEGVEKARKGSKWTPRMLVAVALFWAWSAADGLKERFQEARKVAAKVFRWLPKPGETYHGFLKQLAKWHAELQVRCMSELRVRMKQDLFGKWEIAGFAVIAGDGSRIELPRTQANELVYSPKRKKKRVKKGKGGVKHSRGKRWRKQKRQSAESIAKSGGDPGRLSPAGAIKAIQEVICHYRSRPDEPRESLWWMLRNALQDDYQRTSSKAARAYPRKKKRERTGVPKITTASKSQVTAARQFKETRPEFRCSA